MISITKGKSSSVIKAAEAEAKVEEDQVSLKLTAAKHALTVDSGMMSVAVLKAKMALAVNPDEKNLQSVNEAKKLAQDVVDATKHVKTAQVNEAQAKMNVASITALLTPDVPQKATPDDLDDTLSNADKALASAADPIDPENMTAPSTETDPISSSSVVVGDVMSKHLQERAHHYKSSLDRDKASVAADKAKAKELASKVRDYTAKLKKSTQSSDEANVRLKHDVEKEAYQSKLYHQFKDREAHHKKVAQVKRTVEQHRQEMEIEQEQVINSREKLQKAVQLQKDLTGVPPAIPVLSNSTTIEEPDAATTVESGIEDAIADGTHELQHQPPAVMAAVQAVSKTLDSASIEAQLKPQVDKLKLKYANNPVALKRAIDDLIHSMVSTKVDRAFEDPTVQNALAEEHAKVSPAAAAATEVGRDTKSGKQGQTTLVGVSGSMDRIQPVPKKEPERQQDEGVLGSLEEGFEDVEKAFGMGR